MNRLYLILFCFLFVAWVDPYADHVSSGNERYSAGKFDEADKEYRTAKKYLPSKSDAPDLSFNRGAAAFKKGDYDKAIEFYKEALASEDSSVQKKAMLGLGNSYYKKGDNDEAINSYMNALKIDPKYEPAKKNLEYLLLDNKDKKQNDKNSKEKENQNDRNKKDDKKSGGENNQKGSDKRNDGAPKINPKGGLSKEQVLNLMKSMEKKPVRRDKGSGKGERVLQNPW